MTEAKNHGEIPSPSAAAVILASLAVGSLILFRLATSSALGVSPDSVNYIGAADSLLDGLGFAYPYAPRTHFPPLYSLALAGVGWILNTRAESAARFLHAGVLLGNILATAALTLRA